MRQLTTGGSLPQILRVRRPRKRGASTPTSSQAERRVTPTAQGDTAHPPASVPAASPRKEGELTQLLRRAMEGNGEYSYSREEFAAALPAWKRSLDLALIVLTLPIWWPFMLVIALWVAISSPGPIFYRQPRVGFKGRRFMIVKFRTMKLNAETRSHETYFEQLMVSDKPMVKLDSTGDPRLIAGGKLLRAIGLDELPQIFNVLRGEMSVVGPRPCTVREFELYMPQDRERLAALPGLTGFWQVNGKNRTTFRQMVTMDVFYAKHLSLALDLKILARTFPVILTQLGEMWQSLPAAGAASPMPPVAGS